MVLPRPALQLCKKQELQLSEPSKGKKGQFFPLPLLSPPTLSPLLKVNIKQCGNPVLPVPKGNKDQPYVWEKQV